MKLISWNVNGIRAVERKGELQSLVNSETPDLLLLQEIKGNAEQFSKYLRENPDYQQHYHSAEKKGYAGTAVWVRNDFVESIKNINFNTHIENLPNSNEGRIAWLSFKTKRSQYDVFSVYFPNGGKSEQAWIEKLEFFDRMHEHMNLLRDNGSQVIVGGDMNVAHTAIDIARAKENDGKIGFHPDERAWMDRLHEDNWSDIWRQRNPGVKDVYSYWDVITKARTRNVGWRIDYFLMDKKNYKRVIDIKYLHDQMGSDHCPILLDLAD